MSEFQFLKERRNNISLETKLYVKKSFDIIDRLHELMEDEKILQKDLAVKLSKSESELSKWLNGMQNFTIKTLCKLEIALGKEIISIPCKRNNTQELPIQTRKFLASSIIGDFIKLENIQFKGQGNTQNALAA